MSQEQAARDSSWLDDVRQDDRWKESRLAIVYLRDEPLPALTGDLSLGGIKVAIHNGVPCLGEPVVVSIAFEGQITEVHGIVRHVREAPWGSVAGVELAPSAETLLARRCLERRRRETDGGGETKEPPEPVYGGSPRGRG